MRRFAVGSAVLLLVTALACTQEKPADVADDLTTTAVQADEIVYKVVYTFGLSGPLAPAARSTLTLSQRPPNNLRSIETVTPTVDDETQTSRAWYAERGGESYACAEYAEGTQCRAGASLAGTFGLTDVDQMLLLLRTPDAFSSVERIARARVAGESATCYRAVPPKPTPVPLRSPQPRFIPEAHSFDFCFAEDGILLRARRTITGEVPEDVEREGRREALLEAQSVTRTVDPADLRLPGQIDGGD
jgi:hypothetical protein